MNLLDTNEVAKILGLSPKTLKIWRCQGQDCGPPFVKLGIGRTALVRYRASDVEDWIAQHVKESDRDRRKK